MQFAKLLLIGSSFLVATLAQQKIAFTQVPASAQAGVATTLEWAGGDDSPVTITLKQGDPDNLETVAILTGSASGNSYTWTPSASLPSRDDYALQISQGVNDINYSGQFSLSGGSSSTSTSSSSSSSASSISSRITPAAVVPITSLSNAIASLNATVAILTNTTASATTTRFIAAGTGLVASGGASAATGTVMSRNTTMSSATLSSSRTSSADRSSTTGDSESTGTSTGSAEGSEATGDAMRMASPLAFVLSAFVAIVYLG